MKLWITNICGYFFNITKRIVFRGFRATNVKKIYNYHRVKGFFDTSGQPSKEQLELIAREGYKAVINLAPNSLIESSVFNEKEILSNANVEFIHIPVDFKQPKQENFDEFVAQVQKFKNEKIWIHCAANMRVSAFVYKYRREILNLPHNEIVDDLKTVWIPNKNWRSFLNLPSRL
jgi:protein tyrosine phosphatase (PTP) superfamily phosphohydrolase (DUF442 family)